MWNNRKGSDGVQVFSGGEIDPLTGELYFRKRTQSVTTTKTKENGRDVLRTETRYVEEEVVPSSIDIDAIDLEIDDGERWWQSDESGLPLDQIANVQTNLQDLLSDDQISAESDFEEPLQMQQGIDFPRVTQIIRHHNLPAHGSAEAQDQGLLSHFEEYLSKTW